MRGRSILAAGLFAVACTEIDTGPNVPASLEFDALPFPAIVAGDTLRDSSGIATPLRAVVFNSDNEEIPGAPVRYAALEPLASVDSATGAVVAGATVDTAVRVVAFVGGLQSAPLRLSIVLSPDSVERSGTVDTLRYSVIDTTVNVSGDLAVRVLHRTGSTVQPVRDWIVTFMFQTPADSARAHLVNEGLRRSQTDTTNTAGIAARRIRLFPAGLTSARDSVVVLAVVRYRGQQLSGSPVRLVVPVQPRVP